MPRVDFAVPTCHSGTYYVTADGEAFDPRVYEVRVIQDGRTTSAVLALGIVPNPAVG
jgi:hypothetical protein